MVIQLVTVPGINYNNSSHHLFQALYAPDLSLTHTSMDPFHSQGSCKDRIIISVLKTKKRSSGWESDFFKVSGRNRIRLDSQVHRSGQSRLTPTP